jgi:hypothetical protein
VLGALFRTALDVTPGSGWDRNSGAGIVMADASADALLTIPAVDFYTLSPCRVFDTRNAVGQTTGMPLTCGTSYSFTVADDGIGSDCGVPTGAKAVSLNVTVTGAVANGNVRVFAAGGPAPTTSSLNYIPGVNRANNAVAPLNASGQMAVLCFPTGSAHVIVDVNGYFK